MRADVMRLTGDVARAMGDRTRAEEAYRYALTLDRDSAAVRLELARLLILRDALEDAERELLAALDTVPSYAEAALELAALRRAQGRAAETIPLLADLLLREPYHFDALAALGESLMLCGKTATRARLRAGAALRPRAWCALYFSGMQLSESIATTRRSIAGRR